MLRHLERKGYLRHRRDGLRHVYQPTSPRDEVRVSALAHVVKTFFEGSLSTTVATLLESKPLTKDEYERLLLLLNEAKPEDQA